MDKENNIKKYFIFIVAAFAVFTYIHDLAKEFFFSEFDDVGHYYECSRLLREGYNPWNDSDEKVKSRADEIFKEMSVSKNQYYGPLHSQGFLLLFMPFTFLPYHQAAIVWVLFTNLAFILGIILLIRYFDNLPPWKAAASFFLILSMWPLREEMHFGQPNILFFFLLAAGLFSIKRKQDILAGLCIALAVTIKETFFAVFLFLLWRRNWRAFFSAVGCFAALKSLPILIFGLDKELSYIHCQYVCWVTGFLRETMSISFSEVIRRMVGHSLGESTIKIIIFCIDLVIFIILLKWLKQIGRSRDNIQIALELSLFTVFAFLISPWLGERHLVVMALPVLVSWYCIDELTSKKTLVLFAVAYLMLALKYSVLSFPPFYRGILAVFCALKAYACLILFFSLGALIKEKNIHAGTT